MTKPRTDVTTRAIALEILQAVLRKGQAFDDAMGRHSALASLEKRDRAFVHALVALTLRRLGQVDAAVRACLAQGHDLKANVHDILRLGAVQILFLGTPHHAAVDTAVELAASLSATRPYKGLINAILRRLTREGAELVAAQDAARLNTPDWLWLSWRQAYGTAAAREIALANMGEALIDISVKADPQEWAAKLGARLLPLGSLRLDGSTRVQDLEGFAEGAWWVQDVAATLPVLVMGDVKGKRVVDLCAAPGGKAMQLAARGAQVVALDRSAKRLEKLKENFDRLKLDIEVVCADAQSYESEAPFDLVLLDAPCSATGTIRRHPDVQRLKTAEDVARMATLQARLLDHAATRLVRAGGTLVYAVCSLQIEEAERQIEAFLARHPDFKRAPVAASEIAGRSDLLTPAGDIRTLPSHWSDQGGMDGFYAARLVKNAK